MNPALPGGAPGAETSGPASDWTVSGRLSYASIPYEDMQQGTDAAPNPDRLAVQVDLFTAELGLSTPWAVELNAQLPMGSLRTTTVEDKRTDTNLGDAELRLRYSLPLPRGPRLQLAGGVVLPTGPYVAKSGAANLPPEASFLTLGRGVPWFLGELQASQPLGRRASVYTQLTARVPLGRTEDEFDWGNEIRGVLGGVVRLPKKLSLLSIAEVQWRGRASEPDPFGEGRLVSDSTGGWWWTLSPSLSYELPVDMSVLAGLRIPVYMDVKGNQLVPGTGAFVAFQGRFGASAAPGSKSEEADSAWQPPEPVAGKITIIDYWATWCAPCSTIDAKLKGAESGWSDVVILRVDASDPSASGVRLPGGLEGLPIVEIYDRDGQRVHLLTGAEALTVVEVVDSIRN